MTAVWCALAYVVCGLRADSHGGWCQIYNTMLCGFGHCGEVEVGVKPVTVAERCRCANNTYTSVIHGLVSGVKKLQSEDGSGRGWVYRGLSGGRLPAHFMERGLQSGPLCRRPRT